MSNPKNQKGKFANFVSSRGFYGAIAICLAGAGVATWLAVDRTIAGIESSNAEIIQNEARYQEFPIVEEAEKKNDTPVAGRDPREQSASSTPSVSSAPPDTAVSQSSAPAASSKPSGQPAQSVKLSYTLPVKGNIVNPFSEGALVKNVTLKDWRTHDGVDIACEKGTEILAAAEGTVTQVKKDEIWGTVVTIDHPDGRQTIYSGLGEVVALKEGEAVMARQVIGKVEGVPCEAADGCHLHFAMKLDGAWVNPLSMIAQA